MSLLASLRVALSMDSAQFEAGAKRAQRTANQTRSTFQKAFGGLGGLVKGAFAGVVSGLSIGLITQGVKSALDYAASLGEVAQSLGVTTKELQNFRYAVSQNGGTVEQADQALGKFAISISRAQAESKQAVAAFGAVGVTLEDLRTKSKSEILGQIADEMVRTGGASKNAAAGVQIFGKGFLAIAPTLDQGSRGLNELADANERLGGVLSDEQIQKADETADKIDDLVRVLSVQISGIVADNADSILDFAKALSELVRFAGSAINALANFRSQLAITEAKARKFNPFRTAEGRQQDRAAIFRENAKILARGSDRTIQGTPKKAPTGSPTPFLGGGGGGGRKGRSSDPSRDAIDNLRDDFQLNNELRRADMDILRAKQQLASDYVERTQLSIQMLDLDKQAYEAELAYQQELFKLSQGKDGLSKADAEILKAKYDQADALQRQAVLEEEEADRKRDYYALEQADFDIARDKLDSERQLANNSAERRDVELRLLDLAYRQERARLEAVLADEKSSYAAKEEARRRLNALNTTYKNDRQGVMRDTAGPFEQAQLQFGDLTDEMENLKVQGIMGAADALTSLTGGFQSFKDSAISAIKAVIAEFIRLQMIKGLLSLTGSLFGGGVSPATASSASSFGATSLLGGQTILPAFATGGGFTIMGNRGVDQNTLSLNGLPIARVSHGERLNIGTGEGSGRNINAPITFNISGNPSRETLGQIAAKTRQGIAQANRKGF